MISGFCTSGYLLIWSDLGWVMGPLIGCLVSSVLYVVVSILTLGVTPRVAYA